MPITDAVESLIQRFSRNADTYTSPECKQTGTEEKSVDKEGMKPTYSE
jgi:hypothetical protein